MRTIQIWECEREECSSRCYISNQEFDKCNNFHRSWRPVTATIQEQPKPAEPRLEDFKGQEIEVWVDDKRWRTYELLYVDWNEHAWLANVDDEIIYEIAKDKLQWRLPLKDRIKHGQGIVISENAQKKIVKFESFTSDGLLMGSDGNRYVEGKWRLPLRSEIENWITED